MLGWTMIVLLQGVSHHAFAGGKVFILHSYHAQFQWAVDINSVIEPALKREGVDYRIFYMDTKRNPSEASKKAAARKAKALIAQYKPQVVIAADDNAQAYVVTDYAEKSPIQFVFCGVNASPEEYGYPARNVTGILERPYLPQTLGVLKTLVPGIQRIAVVSDASLSSSMIFKQLKVSLAAAPDSEIDVLSYAQPPNRTTWQLVIERLDQDPHVDAILIPLYHTVQEKGARQSMSPRSVLEWTMALTRKPIVGLWPHFIRNGGLLAVTVDPLEHGAVAAEMTLDILSGMPAERIPMVVNKEGSVMINLTHFKHLAFDPRVEIDQLADVLIR